AFRYTYGSLCSFCFLLSTSVCLLFYLHLRYLPFSLHDALPISANPTGDLHIGHARNAAVGDTLANILEAAGYNVTREYYINDAGNQITNLARSIEARYFEALGDDSFEMPEGGYHG